MLFRSALDTIKSLLYFDCDDHSKAVIMSFSLTCRVTKVRRRSAFRILFSRQLIAGAHIRADVYDDDGLSCMHAEVAQLPDDPGSLQFCARKLGRRRCVAAAET